MKISRQVRVAFVSLSILSVACDNGTPMFTEAVIGLQPEGANPAPGEDAVAESPNEGEPFPVDDSTPEDRGEAYPAGPALTSWTFQASTLEQGSLLYRPSARLSWQSLSMEAMGPAWEKNYTQIDRPMITELHAQGSDIKRQSEIFRQNGSAQGALDLLLVIDNSGSMKEEQENLSNKLSPLLSYVSDSDWRIGVVTTDPRDGCLRSLIKKSDSGAEQAFSSAVQAGIRGSGNERGILQAVEGLKGECNPSGSWLRPQSTVAVLIVSDEDNCSAGGDCGNEPWSQGSYLTNYLSSIRQPGLNARVYGLIGHPSLSSSQCRTMAAKAHIYGSVIADTIGSWGSICSSDYSGTLRAISQDISVILMTQFSLRYKPTPGSVKVFIDGVAQTSGYSVHGQVIEFASAPAAGAVVSFDYEFNAEAPKSVFALQNPAAAGSVRVYLDGRETQAFSYDVRSSSLVFSAAPSAREIKAVYRRGDELPRDFQLERGQELVELEVSVSGQALRASEYRYDSASGVLTLDVAPSDKAMVTVKAHSLHPRALDYVLHTVSGDRSAWDGDSGRSISALFSDASVSFPETEYSPGRKVLIKGVSPATWLVPLSPSVIGESLKVKGLAAGSLIDCEDFAWLDGRLDLSRCGYDRDEDVQLDFTYEKERRDVFDLATLEDFALEKAKWTVKVNGVPSQDFKIVSGQLHMTKLPLKALIEVTMERAPLM